ncbi:MAG: glycosyltransferase [Candidatus Omnitrophota bacterium]
MSSRACIVIPCFNEAKRLDVKSFTSFFVSCPDVYFLFVNDGSRDLTGVILDDMSRAYPRQVACLHLPCNVGKAEAVRRGFLKVFDDRQNDLVGYFDADLAAPLSCLLDFISYFSDHDCEIVMGARVKLLGRQIERHLARHFLGRIFATAVSMILRLPVYDTQCGAKLFRNTQDLRNVFSRPFMTRWIFDVEILARFMAWGDFYEGKSKLEHSCIEHPLREWVDRKGSKLKVKDFLISILDLVRILFFLRAGRNRCAEKRRDD